MCKKKIEEQVHENQNRTITEKSRSSHIKVNLSLQL